MPTSASTHSCSRSENASGVCAPIATVSASEPTARNGMPCSPHSRSKRSPADSPAQAASRDAKSLTVPVWDWQVIWPRAVPCRLCVPLSPLITTSAAFPTDADEWVPEITGPLDAPGWMAVT